MTLHRVWAKPILLPNGNWQVRYGWIEPETAQRRSSRVSVTFERALEVGWPEIQRHLQKDRSGRFLPLRGRRKEAFAWEFRNRFLDYLARTGKPPSIRLAKALEAETQRPALLLEDALKHHLDEAARGLNNRKAPLDPVHLQNKRAYLLGGKRTPGLLGVLGNIPVQELSRECALRFRDHVSRRWDSGHTKAHAWNAFTCFLKWLSFRFDAPNPSKGIPGFKPPSPEPRPLPLPFVHQILDAAGKFSPAFRKFLLGLFFTGARPKELRDLRRSQVDHQGRGTLTIQGAKGGGWRIVEYPESLRREIELPPRNPVYLFCDDRGQPLTKIQMDLWVRDFRRRFPGLSRHPNVPTDHRRPYWTPYDFRDTAGTLVRQASHTRGLEDAATFLGNSPLVAAKVYTRPAVPGTARILEDALHGESRNPRAKSETE